MIEIKDVYKKFGRVEVLKGVDLSIKKGGIFAVLGPNGSGKTTLIKCILGMVLPDKGNIEVMGENIRSRYEYRNEIDYLPQIARFPSNLKVKELIKMIGEIRPKSADPESLIRILGLQPVLNQKLGVLSGGTKQKVNLVLTFMFDGKILILDEPTTGLDPVSLIQLKKLIASAKEEGKTILITSHIMSFVEEIASEIVFILDGKIYFKGTVHAIKETTRQKDLENAIATIMTNELIENN
jgi:Cu-processing system ATP-binding protein